MYVGLKVRLSEQICVCDNIQFEMSVKYAWNKFGLKHLFIGLAHKKAAKQSYIYI